MWRENVEGNYRRKLWRENVEGKAIGGKLLPYSPENGGGNCSGKLSGEIIAGNYSGKMTPPENGGRLS